MEQKCLTYGFQKDSWVDLSRLMPDTCVLVAVVEAGFPWFSELLHVQLVPGVQ